MLDPEFIPAHSPEFYRHQPAPKDGFKPWSKPRTFDELQKSLNVAHDNLRRQVGFNDNLRQAQLTLVEEMKWLGRWTVGLSLAVAGLLVKVVIDLLLP
jgi:hypothetical protein